MTNPRRRRRRPIAPPYTPPQSFYAAVPVPQPPAFKEPPRASVQVLRDKNATVANVTVSQMTDYTRGPDYTFETSGSTKREQGDRYDPQTGDLMAIGRALRNAGNEMITEANRRVQAIVEDQAEERRRAAERRENKSKPVKRRTRAEWEAMQRAEQQERNHRLARTLGLTPTEEWGGSVSSVASMAAEPASVLLSYNRTLHIEDDRVTLRDSSGNVVMVIDRA